MAQTIDYEKTRNMTWKAIVKKITAKRLTRLVLSFMSVCLFHPIRFSEPGIRIKGLTANDILKELHANNIMLSTKPFKEKCEINVDLLSEWQPSTLEERVLNVVKGGRWEPDQCHPQFDSTIIVPYRNRASHLERFLQWMHPFLQAQNISYTIYVIEQLPGKPFNRAKLFNIGFQEAKKLARHKQCLVFHDVDLLPLNAQNIYGCSNLPIHLSAFVDTFRFNLPYLDLFGGALSVSEETFEAVNGFSNSFFGWGGEDDDFWTNRILPYTKNLMIRYDASIAKYQMLNHEKEQPAEDRFTKLEEGHYSGPDEGLNSLNYSVISSVERDLYTHILVVV